MAAVYVTQCFQASQVGMIKRRSTRDHQLTRSSRRRRQYFAAFLPTSGTSILATSIPSARGRLPWIRSGIGHHSRPGGGHEQANAETCRSWTKPGDQPEGRFFLWSATLGPIRRRQSFSCRTLRAGPRRCIGDYPRAERPLFPCSPLMALAAQQTV